MPARDNPLVYFANQSAATPRSSAEVLAPLLATGAREAFARVYTKVPLDLGIVVRPAGWEGADYASGFTRRKGARGQHEADCALAQAQQCLLLVAEADTRVSGVRTPRGDPTRTTAMTPFAVLHRVADTVLGLETPAVRRAVWPLVRKLDRAALKVQAPPAAHIAEIESRGVDTAAGRQGVLSGVGADAEASGQAFADLFAAWMITGKLRYSATIPPSRYPGEDAFRQVRTEVFPKLFTAILKVLRQRGHTPLYITS